MPKNQELYSKKTSSLGKMLFEENLSLSRAGMNTGKHSLRLCLKKMLYTYPVVIVD